MKMTEPDFERTIKRTLAAAAGALAAAAAAAAGGAPQTAPEALTPEAWAKTLKAMPEGNFIAGAADHAGLFCNSCHGKAGNADSEHYPSLGGQPAEVIIKALLDYRDGRRSGDARADLMAAAARPLTDQQIANLAAIYAAGKLPAPREAARGGDVALKLVTKGDVSRNITPCAACHGVSGRGNPNQAVPVLYGQGRNYLEIALKQYRDGTRTSDMLSEMRFFAKELTDEEIAGLAGFFATHEGLAGK